MSTTTAGTTPTGTGTPQGGGAEPTPMNEFEYKTMESNADGLVWSSVVDEILNHEETRNLLGVRQTGYKANPVDRRDIASINGKRLGVPVPVDYLNDAVPSKAVSEVQDTLLDVYALINDGQRPTKEQLRVDIDELQ